MTATSVWAPERASLGEGPLCHHLRGSLVWCDINGASVYERPFAGERTRKFDLPLMPSAAGILDEHAVLLATETDFRRLDLDSGETEVLMRFPKDSALRSNDGRVHPSGAFWVGTMAKRGGRSGDIWRLFDGALTKLVEGVRVPNSICFAGDGRTAYYTDTPTRTILKVPTDAATGAIVGPATAFATLADDEPGGPDGSVVDAAGNLWNARWGGGAIDVYDPDGVRIASHEVPVRQPTCPAFIGDRLDRIVTTSAAAGLKTTSAADGAVVEIEVAVAGRSEPIARP